MRLSVTSRASLTQASEATSVEGVIELIKKVSRQLSEGAYRLPLTLLLSLAI